MYAASVAKPITDDDHGDHPVETVRHGRCIKFSYDAYLATGRVGGDGGHVLDTANAHTGTSKGAESALCTGTGGLGASTTGGTELDVQSGDTDFAAAGGDILGSQHGRVGGGLVTIGLDFHAT